jgi:formate hydrogenlyase subunit 6/NADH:ubiquinone oxidoreductase subunit I
MVDKASKRFVMTYHLDRCTFCAQCVHSCAQNALELASGEWDLAATNKEQFTLCYGDEADVQRLLGNLAGADAGVLKDQK